MDSAQRTTKKKSYDCLHKVSEESKTKFKRGIEKQTKNNIPKIFGKNVNQYDIKRSLSSIVDVVNPFTPIKSGSLEVLEIYNKLDDLKAQDKKSEFQKLVIETVKSVGFIEYYSRGEYEDCLHYAMPFYFLTGMVGILQHSQIISGIISQPETHVRLAIQCMESQSENIAPWIISGSIAIQALFQLNLLCMNEDNIKVYLPSYGKKSFSCKAFQKEQYLEITKSLKLLNEFACKIAEENIQAASEMMPSILQCRDTLSSCSEEFKVERIDFLTIVKGAVLSLDNPFSMSSLYEALPILKDESALQLSSITSALPLLTKTKKVKHT